MQLFDIALEAGAEDVVPNKTGGFRVITEASSFGIVRDALMEAGVEVDPEASGLTLTPLTTIEVCDPNMIHRYQESDMHFDMAPRSH